MHTLAYVLASLPAGGIIIIGLLYLLRPRMIAASFGLPQPQGGPEVDWWLRLKGVRDIASGLAVIAIMIWGSAFLLGLLLVVFAVIPTGDMLTILAARGSSGHAFGIHGATAALMMLVGVPLVMGQV